MLRPHRGSWRTRLLSLAVLSIAVGLIDGGHRTEVLAAVDPLRCDFDSDGQSDLAIGVPGDNSRRGAVMVQYSPTGTLDAPVYYRRGLNLPGTATTHEELGSALACGDFNGDGFGDLAIGVPGESDESGGVSVVYGTSAGLADIHATSLTKANIGLGIDPTTGGERFGSVLAAGDFNADGRDDLAIGVPNESATLYTPSFNVFENIGAVYVVFGSSADGLTGPAQWFSPMTPGACCFVKDREGYGKALAVGDFDNDGVDDLAIGVPYARFRPARGDVVTAAGAVHVLRGEAGEGLVLDGQLYLDERMVSPATSPRGHELFGWSLAAGQFDGSNGDDLAIGSPFEKFDEKFDEHHYTGYGAVRIAYFDGTGAVGSSRTFTSPPPWPDAPFEYERFGYALAAGNFDGEHHDDLAIGAPGNLDPSEQKISMGGWVVVVFSEASGLTEKGAHTFYPGDMAHGVQTPAPPVGVGFDFGSALAAGDYQGDGIADLFIGVPSLTVGVERMGGVEIRPGANPNGFTTSFLLLTQDTLQVGQTWAAAPSPPDGERMGAALGR